MEILKLIFLALFVAFIFALMAIDIAIEYMEYLYEQKKKKK